MFRRQVSVLSLVAFLACASPAAAAEITFGSGVFDVGSTFEVSILVSDAPDLYSYGFEVLFDPNVLMFQSAVNGDLLPDDGFFSFFDFDDPFANRIDIANSLVGEVPGALVDDGVLAVLTFLAVGTGPANIQIPPFNEDQEGTILTFGPRLFNSGLPTPENPEPTNDTIIPVLASPGEISVAPSASVPEPSSLVLLGVGLLATARRLRRRRPAATKTT